MFEAEIDAGVLKECIEAIIAVVDEGKLRISAEGLNLRAVDPSNVAMVTFQLQKDAFDDYQFSNGEGEGDGEGLEIGMDFQKLLGILGIGGKEQVRLSIDEQAQKLYTRMGSLAYTVNLLEPSSLRKEPKVPELEFPVQVVMDIEDFRRTIRAAEKVGEYILLGVDGDEFYMEVEGEMDKLRLGLRKEQLIHLTPGTLHSLFTLDYIAAMSKGMSHAENVTLNLGKDYPLQIDFEVADGKGKVSYLLAPRVE
ncbi:MAG: DNA polymerase sliding clamp [Methanophagales archaeon]|nr:DNA polymerase sliding clamp [Methanophagales archaeon]MCW7069867.1 DNA polymerase sliding clamp [Methanophagales archaeon]MCW7072954.1 DNA polymerase sliding clamp [Methanophagales archaeon]